MSWLGHKVEFFTFLSPCFLTYSLGYSVITPQIEFTPKHVNRRVFLVLPLTPQSQLIPPYCTRRPAQGQFLCLLPSVVFPEDNTALNKAASLTYTSRSELLFPSATERLPSPPFQEPIDIYMVFSRARRKSAVSINLQFFLNEQQQHEIIDM